MNNEFFKVKVEQTQSFEDYLILVEKEVNKFVQDVDLKTYNQCIEFFKGLFDPLKELKNADNLKWDKDSAGKELFSEQLFGFGLNKEFNSGTMEVTNYSRESLIIIINNKFIQEYTVINDLTKEESKNLELNFRKILLDVIMEFGDMNINQQIAENNKDVLITTKISEPTSMKKMIKSA